MRLKHNVNDAKKMKDGTIMIMT